LQRRTAHQGADPLRRSEARRREGRHDLFGRGDADVHDAAQRMRFAGGVGRDNRWGLREISQARAGIEARGQHRVDD